MIYTCTLNPSLDYFMEFDQFESGKVNRCRTEYFEPGGKGINVSIVLNNLRIPSKALGFIGGFVKDYFVQRLGQYEYIQPNFTYIKNTTRINVKVAADQETDLNAKGPDITEEEKRMMLRRVENMSGIDILVLSGSCPENCVDLAEEMMQKCEKNGVTMVLDTEPSIMKRFLKYKPLLVKPNLVELEEMFEQSIQSRDQLVQYARQIIDLGAQNCIVSLGAEGAILATKTGVYHCNGADGKTVSTTGAGDSVVAGFLMTYLRSRDILEIFQYAGACGSATALLKGLATREKVDEIVHQIKVTQIA